MSRYEWMNEWINKWVDMNEWMNKWVDMNEWMNEWMNELLLRRGIAGLTDRKEIFALSWF